MQESNDLRTSPEPRPMASPESRPPQPNAVRTALRPAEAQAALEELRALCASKGEHSEELDRLMKRLREADYRSEATQVLQEALSLPEPNPHVGALWIRRVVTSKAWNHSYPAGLEELCRRGEVGRRGVLEFVELAGQKKRGKLVLKALRRQKHWLRSHPTGWNIMARALANAGCFAQAARWTRDWRKRPEAGVPALHARARALRGLGEYGKATLVMEAAVAQSGPEPELSELKLWLAMEKGLARQTEDADRILRELKPAGWSEDAFCVYYLARGVIRVQQAEKAERGEAFESAYRRILDRFRGKRVYLRPWGLRRDYRRCLWRMSLDSGHYGNALAAWWHSADSLLVLVPLLVIPPLQLLLPLSLFRLFARRKGKPRW